MFRKIRRHPVFSLVLLGLATSFAGAGIWAWKRAKELPLPLVIPVFLTGFFILILFLHIFLSFLMLKSGIL